MLDLTSLNPEQRAAVENTEGPLLLLAGAGTGKTRALTFRIAHMVADRNVSPYQILALTFTNKAAAEMRARLAQLLEESGGLRGMWVATFHAMCVRMLRADAELLGYTRNFSIYDDDDSKRLMKEVFATLGLSEKQLSPASVRERISKAKNELLSAELFSDVASSYPERLTARAYSAYQERLRQADAMDFDDLLVNCFRLLNEHPQVLAAYQERFRYLLVDEYQDTNHAQYRIAALLAEKYRNIMVVGDDDQSIYSWRGADIRNILEFERDYPEARVLKLEQNYRSSSTILSAANAVIANNSQRKHKQLFTQRDDGERIALYQASDERDEGRWIAGEIERLHRGGRAYRDFAVFYRTNAQSRVLEDMLLRAGVPYRIIGGTRFFDRAEIRDVMAYLKLLVNPADDIACKRIINTPRRGIGKTSIERIEDLQRHSQCPFFAACELMLAEDGISAATKKSLADFVRLIREAQRYEGTLRALVENIVEASGLLTALENERTDEAATRAENIREFFGVAEEFDFSHREADEVLVDAGTMGTVRIVPFSSTAPDSLPPSENGTIRTVPIVPPADAPAPQLIRFMEWLALRSDLDTLVESDSYVTLMTVHSAKGLEFPVVFIAGLEESIFPHYSASAQHRNLEEERRLAYVAITRARELLYLAHTQIRSLYGKTNNNPRSRFVAEIPAELLSLSGIGSTSYLGFGTEKRGSRRGILGSGTGTGRMGVSLPAADDTDGGHVFGASAGSACSAVSETVPEASELFSIGDDVVHKIFGPGIVEFVEDDAVTIRFAKSGQTKKLLAGLAPIVRLKQ
ncbi:MAG: UvrD-helicase domain-containing protein [Coriobacteriales bacterium]|nr:UvrD-helicase domain-containing protein [Coriobacteriales bacterium]